MNLRLSACLAVLLCISAASCGSSPPEKTGTIDDAQSMVDAIAGVRPGNIPEHFLADEPPTEVVRQEGDWDVAEYLGVLSHLSVEPGWVIDYLYVYDGMGGYPFIYARPADKPPYASTDDYLADSTVASGGETVDADEYLHHIETDGTSEAYFELVALEIMADQFYQYWHAGYNDLRILCDEDALERTLSAAGSAFGGDGLPASVERQARKIDLEPTVAFPDDSTAVVRVVTFTKWGGFSERHYTLSRQFPHSQLDVESQTLVEYDCGVSF